MNLLLITKAEKKQYVLIKDFNRFMYNQSNHKEKNSSTSVCIVCDVLNQKAITKKVQGCRLNDNNSYTKAYQTHEDCGYGYKVVYCYEDKYSKPIQKYQSKNAVYRFMKRMLEEVE